MADTTKKSRFHQPLPTLGAGWHAPVFVLHPPSSTSSNFNALIMWSDLTGFNGGLEYSGKVPFASSTGSLDGPVFNGETPHTHDYKVLRRRSDWNKAPAHPFTHHSPSKLLGMHFNLSDLKLTFDRIGLQPTSPPPPVHLGQTCLVIAHPASHPIPSTPQFPSISLDSS
ncbi:hypothetical protein CROQUDRAFT_92933 [Cronartium quercuum f. sp. fusiforme G11]|uniref:Uncharacterized protein n=1 Tax=Cronartium quercuum f. sp. fusiforme G11 TaxID=708437 RepID=A0A9P6NL84_9BASI|nr:hypothetical protein CROQUDRAFT_92933 [Cronartium quercuum f. sp. fusiforme G11]